MKQQLRLYLLHEPLFSLHVELSLNTDVIEESSVYIRHHHHRHMRAVWTSEIRPRQDQSVKKGQHSGRQWQTLIR